jgi:hypothetical protein
MNKVAKQIEWSWEDGWLLMALFRSQETKGARLCNLIAVADMTAHEIPSAKALSSALTKFVRCRLVMVRRGRYRLSPQHDPAILKAHNGRGGLFRAGDKGLKWLKRAALSPQNAKRVVISAAQHRSAVEQYKSWFKSL